MSTVTPVVITTKQAKKQINHFGRSLLIYILLFTFLRHGMHPMYEAMPKLFPEAGFMRYYLDLMDKAIDLSQKDVDDRNAIRQLGEGWVAEETLAIAVYCAIKHADSFEDAIVASVNHDGDSDSTGAVTGNILGTALGYTSIPDHYLEKLELRDIIEEISEDLYNDCQMSEYTDYRDPVWESKYIYVNYDKKKRAQLRK